MNEDSPAGEADDNDGFLEGNVFQLLGIKGGSAGSKKPKEQPFPKISGKYQVVRPIGEGGHGTVYEALDIENSKPVAIKLLHASQHSVNRLRREIEALRTLSHPSIVAFRDAGVTDDGYPALVMEYVDGQPISDYCEAQESISWKTIVALMIEACIALEHAHSRGVLHCDLKPHNILVRPDGSVAVTDFGLAKFLNQSGDITVSETARGTPAYMAPEQLQPDDRQQAISVRVDVFGLGATLYRLLSGRSPRAGHSTWSAVALIATQQPIPPLQHSELGIPVNLAAVVSKALDQEAERRYSSVAELRSDLENVLGLRPVSARAPSVVNRFSYWCRREPGYALLSGATLFSVLFGVVALVLLTLRERTARQHAEQLQHQAELQREVAEQQQFRAEQLQKTFAIHLIRSLNPQAARAEADIEVGDWERHVESSGLIGPGNPQVVDYIQDHPAEARSRLQHGLSLCRQIAPDSEFIIDCFLNALAVCNQAQDRHTRASRTLEKLLEKYEDGVEDQLTHEMLVTLNFNMAISKRATGRLDSALSHLETCRNISDEYLSGKWATEIRIAQFICAVMADRADLVELLRPEFMNSSAEALPPVVGISSHMLRETAQSASAIGEDEKAERLLLVALTLNRSLGRDGHLIRQLLSDLTNVMLKQRRFVEAEPYIRDWLSLQETASADEPPSEHEINMARNSLIECLYHTGRVDEAVQQVEDLMQEHQELRDTAGRGPRDQAEKARTWILFSLLKALHDVDPDDYHLGHAVEILCRRRLVPEQKSWYLTRTFEECQKLRDRLASTDEGQQYLGELDQLLGQMAPALSTD